MKITVIFGNEHNVFWFVCISLQIHLRKKISTFLLKYIIDVVEEMMNKFIILIEFTLQTPSLPSQLSVSLNYWVLFVIRKTTAEFIIVLRNVFFFWTNQKVVYSIIETTHYLYRWKSMANEKKKVLEKLNRSEQLLKSH